MSYRELENLSEDDFKDSELDNMVDCDIECSQENQRVITIDELAAENRVLKAQLIVLEDQVRALRSWIAKNNYEIGKQLEDMKNET